MAGYPVSQPLASGWLDVGDGHQLYWEEAGARDGVPALILHGGPGSGYSPTTRRFFDPERYRIIGFDQRNAGRSRPSAAEAEAEVDLSTNTTAHLVADIERLRAHFGVERWVIFGASWGTTLGLAYAEQHPERVQAMVFAGVTTTRRSEIDWLYRWMAPLLPEEWERFRAGVPEGTPDEELVAAYNELMFDADAEVRAKAARDFHDWDKAAVSANQQQGRPSDGVDPARMLSRGADRDALFPACGVAGGGGTAGRCGGAGWYSGRAGAGADGSAGAAGDGMGAQQGVAGRAARGDRRGGAFERGCRDDGGDRCCAGWVCGG